MPNSIVAYVATVHAGSNIATSAYITFSFQLTAGFEAWVPIRCVTTANVSAGAEVYVWRSMDGGANWETLATLAEVFPRASSTNAQKGIRLDTGQYLIGVLTGGPNGVTVMMETAWVVTAYS